MFGIYRYGLAFCVAISHLWAGMIGGPAAYAVWGFYCLSGYLMTLILNEKYGFSRADGRRGEPRTADLSGLLRRLHRHGRTVLPQTGNGDRDSCPTSSCLASAGMAVLDLSHDNARRRRARAWLGALRVERAFSRFTWRWRWDWRDTAGSRRRGSRPASSTRSGCSRSERRFAERYTFIPACSLAFSFGSLIYHVRDWLPVIKTPWAALSAAAIWWLHVWLTQNIPGGPWIYGPHSSLIVSAFAMITLMRLDAKHCLPGW